MNFGSLFSGIGGFDLGLERAGMSVSWQVEIDPYCNKVLEKHWPEVKRYGDIKNIDWSGVDPIDLLYGGFPCQPHSLAGKRVASGDDRDLWPEFARAIRELKPRWVVAENVRGLLSSEAGQFFGGILRELAFLGYDAEWQVLPAAAFGAPHIRERIFLLAYPNSSAIRLKRNDAETRDQSDARGIKVADTQGKRWRKTRKNSERSKERSTGSGNSLAYPEKQHGAIDRQKTSIFGRGGEIMADTHGTRCKTSGSKLSSRGETTYPLFGNASEPPFRNDWWEVEPNVGRVADGVSARVDRLRGLGNAIVPQVAEWIGRMIVEREAESGQENL